MIFKKIEKLRNQNHNQKPETKRNQNQNQILTFPTKKFNKKKYFIPKFRKTEKNVSVPVPTI